jgi:hypothetical protein
MRPGLGTYRPLLLCPQLLVEIDQLTDIYVYASGSTSIQLTLTAAHFSSPSLDAKRALSSKEGNTFVAQPSRARRRFIYS